MVQPGSLGDLRDRIRLARQLAKRLPQPILARRPPLLGRHHLWRYHRRSRHLLGRRKWRGRPVARPTSGAHHHRHLAFRAGHLKLPPAAARAANRAPTASTLDLDQIFRRWHTRLNIEGPRSRRLHSCGQDRFCPRRLEPSDDLSTRSGSDCRDGRSPAEAAAWTHTTVPARWLRGRGFRHLGPAARALSREGASCRGSPVVDQADAVEVRWLL